MAAITFTDHEGFHQTVIRAAIGSAVAGLVAWIAGPLGAGLLAQRWTSAATLALAAAAVGIAAAASGWRSRLVFGAAGFLCGLAPLLFPAHRLFGLAAAGLGLGALLAQARRLEERKDSSVGRLGLGRAAVASAAALTALALIAGRLISDRIAASQLVEPWLPGPLPAMLYASVLGFFASLGAAGAHLVRDPDPVEQLYASLHSQLAGDLAEMAARAMTNYRRCAEILAGTDDGFARNQLSKSLSEITRRVLELGQRWQSIDRELGARAEGEIGARLAELEKLRDGARDEIAKKQLAMAASALRAELEQIDRIRRNRERVLARLHGQMAILDRARIALLGLKSSDAQLRTAELSALSETLSGLSREMDSESQAVDEVVGRAVDAREAGRA